MAPHFAQLYSNSGLSDCPQLVPGLLCAIGMPALTVTQDSSKGNVLLCPTPHHTELCRLQEAELSEQAVAAVVKLSRDTHIPTKLAAARATGHLLLAELDGHMPEGCAMEPLVPVLVALIGRDQNSEVQRQGLQVSHIFYCRVMYTADCTMNYFAAVTAQHILLATAP